MIPVEGHKHLFRDENSGAIINHDTYGYSQYIRSRNERKKQRDEIETIKNDIEQIKSMLKEILNGSKGN
jgi:hypothetical protein